MRQEQGTGTQSLIRACYCPGLLIRFWKSERVWIYFSVYLHLSICAELKENQMSSFSKSMFIHHRETHITVHYLDATPSTRFSAWFTAEHKRAWLCSQGGVKEISLTLFFQAANKNTFYRVRVGTLTSKCLHSRVVEAIHLAQYQAGSESEITYHASTVVGHILYYLMEYSLLGCRGAEK